MNCLQRDIYFLKIQTKKLINFTDFTVHSIAKNLLKYAIK